MSDKEDLFSDVEADSKDTGKSGSGHVSKSLDEPEADATEFILDAMDAKGGGIYLPAFAEDAPEASEAHEEEYGIEGTLSVEDIFGLDLEDADTIANLPTTDTDNVDEDVLEEYPDEIKRKKGGDGDLLAVVPKPEVLEEAKKDLNIKSGVPTDVRDLMNGYNPELVADRLGDQYIISTTRGKKRNHEDEMERLKHIHFSPSKTPNRPFDRQRARFNVGEIDWDELEEWAIENGFEEKVSDEEDEE